jgi:hypothetical protein
MTTAQPRAVTMARPRSCLTCHLEGAIEEIGCHGDHSLTNAWIAGQPDPPTWVLPWAEAHGGHCDCEVLFNAVANAPSEPRFAAVLCEEARRAYTDVDPEEEADDEEYEDEDP